MEKTSSDGNICYVQDGDALVEAVMNLTCPTIILNNYAADEDTYMIMEEIVVSRHVTIIGHPTFLPIIDASMIIRLEVVVVVVVPGGGGGGGGVEVVVSRSSSSSSLPFYH